MGPPELSLICTIFALLSPKTQACIGFLFLKYLKKKNQASQSNNLGYYMAEVH